MDADDDEGNVPVASESARSTTQTNSNTRHDHSDHDRSRSRSRSSRSESRERLRHDGERSFSRSPLRSHSTSSTSSSTGSGPSNEHNDDCDKASTSTGPAFIASAVFEGARSGYVFRYGGQGLGYYVDVGSAAASAAAQEAEFSAASNAEGVVSGPDAPILAALGSHREALDEASCTTSSLEAEAVRWGRVSGTIRHNAEMLEVRLTDQLLQLTNMLDDCETADARTRCKALISRLREMGTRLLKLSQPRN